MKNMSCNDNNKTDFLPLLSYVAKKAQNRDINFLSCLK